MMQKALLAVVTAVAVLAGGVSHADIPPSFIDLPQIGEPADNMLSPMQERQLGARIMAQLYASDYLLEDSELTDYITGLGWRLAANSRTKAPDLTFFVVNDARINAFALPGGYVGFNAGLLLAANSESEVAGVMGHELAHVTQRHIARSGEDTQVATIATWLGVIAAIIAGSADPDVVIGALSIGQAMNYQRQVNYTRAHEQEADRIGIQTMARAGFDPEGMASFFQKLQQQSRLYGSGLPEILRTHPLSVNRVAEARARAAELPKVDRTDPIEFQLMRARARVLTADRAGESTEYFGRELAAGRDTPANRYGLALALSRTGQTERAEDALKPLLEKYPRQVNIQLLSGQLRLLAKDTRGALEISERMLKLYPRYAPAILGHANTLMMAGKPEEARQVLLSYEQTQGTQVETYSLLAQAARESGNLAEASFQMASFLLLRGDAGGALAQIDAGLRLNDLSNHDRSRLIAKRREARDTLPENWRPPSENSRRGADDTYYAR